MMDLQSMKTKYLLTNNLSFGRNVIIELNLKKQPVLNYRLMTIHQFLKEHYLNKRFINNHESSLIMYQLIKENGYGFPQTIITRGGVKKLYEVIFDYLICDNDSFLGIYQASYKQLIDDYNQYLTSHSLIDYIQALKLINKRIDAECFVLEDLLLAPLEEKMLKNVFGNFTYLKISSNQPHIKNLYDCYGIYNEVLNCLETIEQEKLNINDTIVYYPNQQYENFFYSTLSSRLISFQMKIHASCLDTITFLKDIINYLDDYKYELLESLVKCNSLDHVYLDEFYKTLFFPEIIVGFGKQRTMEFLKTIKDKTDQEHIYQFISELIDIKDKDIDFDKLMAFLFKYLPVEEELKEALLNIRPLYLLSDEPIETLNDEIDKLMVSVGNGGLTLSLFEKNIPHKKNVFIIGLSQMNVLNSYPENPFIIDVDLYDKTLNYEGIHLVKYLKNQTTNNLEYLINHTSAHLYCSYSSFDKINGRPTSPSVFFLKMKKMFFEEESIQLPLINYYPILNGGSILLKKDEKVINTKDEEKSDKNIISLSPSSIKILKECPFHYYYHDLLNLVDVQYPKLNEYEWLEANTKGTFFHKILEEYAKRALFKDNFQDTLNIDYFNEAFDIALKDIKKVSVIKNETLYQKEAQEIKELALDYLADEINENFKNQKYRVLGCEYPIKNSNFTYSNNGITVKFSGFIDRVDGYIEDDILHLRFVDYKTGKVHAKKDNPHVQHIIYSEVLKNSTNKLFNLSYKQIVVDSFTYDYAFEREKIEYSASEISDGIDEVYQMIDKVVIGFYTSASTYFDDLQLLCPEKINCTYCHLKDVCIKKLKGEC